MIEAPEALCLSEQLNGVIKGKVVTDVIPCYTPHKFAFFTGIRKNTRGCYLVKWWTGLVLTGEWCK